MAKRSNRNQNPNSVTIKIKNLNVNVNKDSSEKQPTKPKINVHNIMVWVVLVILLCRGQSNLENVIEVWHKIEPIVKFFVELVSEHSSTMILVRIITKYIIQQ